MFTSSLLQNLTSLMDIQPNRIIFSYSEDQPIYDELKAKLKNISFIQGLDFEILLGEPTILVIDDQMYDSSKTNKIQELFVRGVHHKSVSIIFITQNLYPQGKFSRDIRLNTNYFVIFKSPAFKSQVACLGRALFPDTYNFLPDAYHDATKSPYSYLFLNLHPKCNDRLRVRTGILPSETEIIYSPK